LELGDEVLVGVLGETAALVRVKEHVVNVERRGNEGLVVGNRGRDGGANVVLIGGKVLVRAVGLRVAGGVAAE